MSIQTYKDFLIQQKALNKFSSDNRESIITGALQSAIEAVPGLDMVVIRGSTPSFNDGDPCYFSLEVIVTDMEDYMEIEELGITEFRGKTEDDFEDEVDWIDYLTETINGDLTWEDDSKVSAFFSPLEDLMASQYNEYGFELIITIVNGVANIEERDYECGY